jgi:hypothetical protein
LHPTDPARLFGRHAVGPPCAPKAATPALHRLGTDTPGRDEQEFDVNLERDLARASAKCSTFLIATPSAQPYKTIAGPSSRAHNLQID